MLFYPIGSVVALFTTYPLLRDLRILSLTKPTLTRMRDESLGGAPISGHFRGKKEGNNSPA